MGEVSYDRIGYDGCSSRPMMASQQILQPSKSPAYNQDISLMLLFAQIVALNRASVYFLNHLDRHHSSQSNMALVWTRLPSPIAAVKYFDNYQLCRSTSALWTGPKTKGQNANQGADPIYIACCSLRTSR